jgi:hypothetical protein
MGFGLAQACRQAMEDLAGGGRDRQDMSMNVVAMNRDGQHFGMSTATGRTYIWMTPGMTEPVEEWRSVVDLGTLTGSREVQAPRHHDRAV